MNIRITLALLAITLLSVPQTQLVASESVLAFVTGANGDLNASYWVTWEQLAQQKHWNPGAESFPASLSYLGAKARDEVLTVRHETNRFSLQKIIVQRISLGARQAERLHTTPQELSNHWAVSAEFIVTSRPHSYTQRIVLLFDGTVADERVGTFREIMGAARGKTALPSSKQMPPPEYTPLSAEETRRFTAQETIDARPENESKADLNGLLFNPPAIEWSPESEFPLDLNSGVPKALSAISAQCHVDEPLLLDDIHIVRYHTNEHFPVRESRRHWEIEFHFRDVRLNGRRDFIADMLLDGSILQAYMVRKSAQ